MKLQKFLSLLTAVALVVSAAAFAAAESAEPAAGEAMTADEAVAAAPVYTLDEMITGALQDAYDRQAAYTAYAEAFPDSRSIANLSVDTPIVLLEMLAKAHDLALPAAAMDVTVPETLDDAYVVIARMEGNAVSALQTYLQQASLTEDARLVFRSVLSGTAGSARSFARRARAVERAREWTELFNSDSMQKYVIEGKPDRGNGSWTITILTNNPDMVPEGAVPADEADEAEPVADETVTETPAN